MTLVFAKLDATTVYLSYPLFGYLAYSAYHEMRGRASLDSALWRCSTLALPVNGNEIDKMT